MNGWTQEVLRKKTHKKDRLRSIARNIFPLVGRMVSA